MHARKRLTLKMKVTEYNIHNGPIRWQISTPSKVILDNFRRLSAFCRYPQFKIRDLENLNQGHDIKHFVVALPMFAVHRGDIKVNMKENQTHNCMQSRIL